MAARRVDKNEKAEHIALTALALFSEKGYRATSVGQIARSAGIGKGTVYQYYQTKEDLFIAAVMTWLAQFESQLCSRLEGLTDPVAQLNAVAQLHRDLYGRIDRSTMHLFLQILQQSMMEGGVIAKRRHLVGEMAAAVTRTVVGILLEGVSRGVFQPRIAREAETIAINLHAYLDGIGLHSIVSDKYFDLNQQIDYYIDNLVRTITIAPAAGPAKPAAAPGWPCDCPRAQPRKAPRPVKGAPDGS